MSKITLDDLTVIHLRTIRRTALSTITPVDWGIRRPDNGRKP
jgi:hypothetical protein